MKLLKNIALFCLVVFAFESCSLEEPIKSTITEYAEFDMSGDKYMFVQEGETFEDPGVAAFAGEDDLEVEVSGAVDANTPGVYVLTYTAINADGFPASTTRYVAVGDKEVASNRDLSGTYAPKNIVTKLATGFYDNSDVLPTNNIHVFMVDLGNGMLIIPPQSSVYGDVYADPSLNANSGGTVDSETSFTLNEYISCCGVFTRTFTKQ